ncbi:MAG: ankyrin repeat domain-containing protein [Bacteroidota bacterium]|nr:ankyrin repeat domain-containing protein [Bacteroidota bacterium]
MKKTAIIFFLILSGIAAVAQNTDDKLLKAVFNDKDKEAFYLLKGGANPNAYTDDGVTPLMYASEKGNIYLCKALIKYGADVNINPLDGTTALISACRNNQTDIMLLLVNNGADVDMADRQGSTGLHYACAYGFPRVADILLHYKAKPDSSDGLSTPLTISAYYGDSTMVDLLLDYGADIHKPDFFGNTPFIMACQENHIKLVEKLYAAGADIQRSNSNGLTGLDVAVYYGYTDLVKYLSGIGLKPVKNIKDGVSTYELAKIKGDSEIQNMLSQGKDKQKFFDGQFSFDIHQSTNFQDYMVGVGGGFHQTVYNVDVFSGWKIRPFRKKVTFQPSDHFFTQYRELRNEWYLGVHKKFEFVQLNSSHFGVYGGGKLSYYHGNYSGSSKTLREFVVVPEAGFYYGKRGLEVKAGYGYISSELVGYSPHSLSICLSFLMNKGFYYVGTTPTY